MSWRCARRGGVHYHTDGFPQPDGWLPYVLLESDAGDPPIVVVSEPPGRVGVSVTNAAEAIRDALIALLGTSSFRLVEHYRHSGPADETFDAVFFTDAGKPVWRPLAPGDRTRVALVALVGGDAAIVNNALDG